MKYTQPKGTFDVLPKQLKEENSWNLSHKWQYIEDIMSQTALEYGFKEIRTPIFETTELFVRSSGDSSDIVSKEMYTFEDKGGRSISLRPEGTAPVIRAFIENHLSQFGSDHKLFYIGPYFRYDRPQAGRFRQFHQFGIEAIGRSDPFQDIEVIDLLSLIYKKLGIKNLKLLINSVGDQKSREAYKVSLLTYLKPYYNDLTKDSQERFTKNPLRILDTKDPKEIELLKNAPSLINYLSEDCKRHFNTVCEGLSNLNIDFHIDSRLVRGLDYYNKTVFEFTSNALGAQSTIGAGGRYDGLIKTLGGADLPSIGFGTGLERILYTMEEQKCFFPKPPSPFVFLIALGELSHPVAFDILCKLRHQEISSEIYLKTAKMQKALQEASESKSIYTIIIGEQELQKGVVQLKNMLSRESEEIPLTGLIAHLQSLWKNRPLEKKP
jgi:histidyl-tRNA synthetase